MATWQMLNIQDSNSPVSENLCYFHSFVMIFMLMILCSVMYMLLNIIMNKFVNRMLLHHHFLEIIWTLIPLFILMVMSFPSLKILYMTDDLYNPVNMTLKVVGHQWYWSYEYSDYNSIEFDSYILLESDSLSFFRLLDVDNRLILPYRISIRLIITSMDVIHSWAVPSLGIKVDSIPGRINQVGVYIMRPGVYFGQCSEICGVNHSFMPIVVEVCDMKNFINWIKSIDC